MKAETFFDSVSGEESICLPDQILEKDEIRGRDDVKPIICKIKSHRQPRIIDCGREVKDVEKMEKKSDFGDGHGTTTSADRRLNSPAPMVLGSKTRSDTKLGCRDDDENFSDCNRLSSRFKTFRHPQSVGDRRIRKSLTSRYWKASSKFRDFEPTKTCKFISA